MKDFIEERSLEYIQKNLLKGEKEREGRKEEGKEKERRKM